MKNKISALHFSFTLLVSILLYGCATISNTEQKPPIYAEYNYSLNEVYLETFNVLSSQSMVFEEGGLDEKHLLFRYWDMGIPVIAVSVNFIQTGKDKTKIELRYNPDGAIPTYNLRTKIESMLRAINDRIMLVRKDEYPRPYYIHNLDEWLKNYQT